MPHFVKVSLISALATLVPILCCCIYLAMFDSGISKVGEIDNDPMRAGWMFIFLSPVIYILLSIYNYLLGRFLYAINKFKFVYFQLIAVIVSLILGFIFGSDDIRYLLSFSATFFGLLTICSIVWHVLTISHYNKQLKTDSVNAAL